MIQFYGDAHRTRGVSPRSSIPPTRGASPPHPARAGRCSLPRACNTLDPTASADTNLLPPNCKRAMSFQFTFSQNPGQYTYLKMEHEVEGDTQGPVGQHDGFGPGVGGGRSAEETGRSSPRGHWAVDEIAADKTG